MYSLKDLVKESSHANAARCGSQQISRDLPSFSAHSIIVDIKSEFNRLSPTSPDLKSDDPSFPESTFLVPPYLEPIVQWYQSPLAKKIRIAEKQIVEHSSIKIFQQTALYKDPIRDQLIEKVVRNTYTAEFVATLGTEIEYTGIVHSGCIQKAAKPGKANREQMLADFTRNDKDLATRLLLPDIKVETAYLFRNLSTDELARYESFTSGKNARRFYQNLITAVQHGLKLAADRVSFASKTN